jgi:hypothetical protein
MALHLNRLTAPRFSAWTPTLSPGGASGGAATTSARAGDDGRLGQYPGLPSRISRDGTDGTEGTDDAAPGWFGVALAFSVFWWLAVWSIVAGRWSRVWFWLTYSVDCAKCRRRLRQAWVPLRYVSRKLRVARVSHTYCAECFEVIKAESQRAVAAEVRRHNDLTYGSGVKPELQGPSPDNYSTRLSGVNRSPASLS